MKGAVLMTNTIAINNNTEITATQTARESYLRSWIEYLDSKERTAEAYTKNVRRFFVYLKEQGIDSPTRADVISYRDYLVSTHKPSTVQAYMQALKLFYKWLESEHGIENIAQNVHGGKVDHDVHKKSYLTADQCKDILSSINRDSLQGLRDYAIVTLMLTAGLRTIEAVRANIEDMQPTAGFTALFLQGKGHEEKGDYVKVSKETEKAIRAYLKARGKTAPSDPLFASVANKNKGERMTTRSISRLVKEAMLRVGLDSDRLTAHSLRHTAATLNLLNGATIEETKQLLRHKNIATTLIYSHALDRASNNSEQRVSNAIFG